MKKASSLLLLSSVVAAAKDVVFPFSSCAWSFGGYSDSQRKKCDDINRQNVWQRINAIYRRKQYQSGFLLLIWE